jgi:hypothetical protein
MFMEKENATLFGTWTKGSIPAHDPVRLLGKDVGNMAGKTHTISGVGGGKRDDKRETE